ncbi:MAG: hypothetical protein AAF813_08990 [Pseudomonadota bacterium]
MKPMIAAFAATALIAVLASQILDNVGFSVEDRTSGDAVRLD